MDPKSPSSGPNNNEGKLESPSPTPSEPPIITYPEFLLRRPSRAAPPLLTPSGVLNTLYLAGGLMATIYGTSRYIITPMISSLHEARLSLARVALAQLHTLNSRLEQTVSEIPAAAAAAAAATQMPPSNDGGAAGPSHENTPLSERSSVSDPTELFHVDVGTQTSPVDVSEQASPVPVAGASSPSASEDGQARLARQEGCLRHLNARLSGLVEDANAVVEADAAVVERLRELSEYLDSLVDTASPYYGSRGGVWGANNNDGGNRGQKSCMVGDEEVNGVKAEIRGIKGVLLNARNFPALGGGKIGGR
ncbi:MAG: hypothetical protein M1816_006234 [Peltula sp. TS41687]|nr:MAG: hypothetical protein M1816_006234 [Peltula sp. TS41687]